MPIYEYHCRACGKEFEELVASKDAPVRCPGCRSSRTQKRMSAFSLGRAGSGAGHATTSTSSCAGCTSKKCSTCR
jgi:putative FmdB family regulatory protein